MNRREFIALVTGATVAYTFNQYGAADSPAATEWRVLDEDQICAAINTGTDYRDWLLINGDRVAVCTGRTEMGQGITTVLTALVSQALEISPDRVDVVLGDTDRCPDDGPTNGSSATSLVAWPFWYAAHEMKKDLVRKGAAQLGVPGSAARYVSGAIQIVDNPQVRIELADLRKAQAVELFLAKPISSEDVPKYIDMGMKNVNGEDIVTGRQKYAGDLKIKNEAYGAFQTPNYLQKLTRLRDVDFSKTEKVPGVLQTGIIARRPFVVAESYESLQQGLRAIEAQWKRPKRAKKYNYENELRATAELAEVMDQEGDVEKGFADSTFVLEETYYTHNYNVCYMEPDVAIADVQKDSATVWASSQYPHGERRQVAERINYDPQNVHILGMPIGGGFGGKILNHVAAEAALISKSAERPIKYQYSRKDVFIRWGRAKDSCILDMKTGVNAEGLMTSRLYDVYLDEGYGFTDVYRIPNSLVRLYYAKMPVRHATVRGTSYAQNVFALESHIDELAAAISMDPVEFRYKNLSLDAFRDLISAVMEMSGYQDYQPPDDEHGLGLAIVNHGARELGAMVVEIRVDRQTGKITVKRVWAAFDVGTIINKEICETGVRGAIVWGLSVVLKEQLNSNGHSILTRSLYNYDIARFSDLPEINIRFIQSYPYNGPRGIGEMPLPVTIAAIANAFKNVTGVRLHRTPFRPDAVLEALAKKQ